MHFSKDNHSQVLLTLLEDVGKLQSCSKISILRRNFAFTTVTNEEGNEIVKFAQVTEIWTET